MVTCNPGHDRPRVHTEARVDAGAEHDVDLLDGECQVQRHLDRRVRVVEALARQPARGHVAVADRKDRQVFLARIYDFSDPAFL